MPVESDKSIFWGNTIVLALLAATVHLLYASTWQSGFVTDFTGLMERLEGAPFSGFLDCFGFPALHQVTNFFLYFINKFFGTNPLPWYLVFTSLHITNGFLGYLLAKKIFKNGDRIAFLHNISIPALLTSLLFLINPYNAETVVWKVCFNFLFCTFCMLSSLLFFIKYLDSNTRKYFIYSILFFIIGLFTFELALALPFMVTLIYFWKNKSNDHFDLNLKKLSLKTLPYFAALPFYFILNKILLGGWVGHYGEGVHLQIDLSTVGSNSFKYFSKYLIYWRDWNHATKESFIAFCDTPVVAILFISVCTILFFAGLFFYKKLSPKISTAWLFLSLFFLAIAPVSNLFVAWVLHGENDRYGYLASFFFFAGLVALLQIFERGIRYGIYILSIVVSVSFSIQINDYWKNSTEVFNGLLSDFRWENNSEIYVLAFPENYKGIPIFKDFSRQDLALKHALKYIENRPTSGKFYQIAQFNLNSPTDGLSATIDSTGLIQMEFYEWGSWWWRNGIGTGDYETEKYIFKTLPKGCEIQFKNTAEDAAFIYSDGKIWKEIIQN